MPPIVTTAEIERPAEEVFAYATARQQSVSGLVPVMGASAGGRLAQYAR
jgi:hypothetical protein